MCQITNKHCCVCHFEAKNRDQIMSNLDQQTLAVDPGILSHADNVFNKYKDHYINLSKGRIIKIF